VVRKDSAFDAVVRAPDEAYGEGAAERGPDEASRGGGHAVGNEVRPQAKGSEHRRQEAESQGTDGDRDGPARDERVGRVDGVGGVPVDER
jgi:hypothetical protein